LNAWSSRRRGGRRAELRRQACSQTSREQVHALEEPQIVQAVGGKLVPSPDGKAVPRYLEMLSESGDQIARELVLEIGIDPVSRMPSRRVGMERCC
jgi:hypothetical protein